MTTPTKGSEFILRCVIEGPDDDTRTEFTLQTDNRDKIAYELAAGKRHWPSIASENAMFLFLTTAAWSALRRSGQLPEHVKSLDAFLDRCLLVEPVKDDEHPDGVVDVDPTSPGASSGSA